MCGHKVGWFVKNSLELKRWFFNLNFMTFNPNLESSHSSSADANPQPGSEQVDEKKHINIKVVGTVSILS